MPFMGIALTLVGVLFAVHAMQTGRPQWWLWVILFVPLVGSLAYVLIELIPEAANSRRARKVQSTVGDIIAPDREWHKRRDEVALTGSIDARRTFAEECERKGMWKEAADVYASCSEGLFKDDPVIRIGLARAQLGGGDAAAALATLDALQAAHPDINSAEGHLLYARALEGLGNLPQALAEYERVSAYFIGLEARTRFALLLVRTGNPGRAHDLFEDVVRAGKRSAVLSEGDRTWLKVARSNL